MKYTQHIFAVGCALLVSGCFPEFDMQGHNPNDYYAAHPIVNKVETRYLTQALHFEPNQSHLDADQRDTLKQHFTRISPLAVDDVEIQVHPSQMANAKREDYLKKLLSQMGIKRGQIQVVPMEEIERHDANIQVAYSAVTTPRCPDWRSSPVTNYSNRTFTPNLGCASTVNLGLMVADPRDLVEGSGDNRPDTDNTTRAIQQYREGDTATGSESSSDSGSSSSSTTGASGQ